MTFTQMHERLRLELLRRIQRGTLSVSLLSRQTGFGQPHLSNFLNGRRRLSLEAIDRVMGAQHMDARDLLPAAGQITSWQSEEEPAQSPSFRMRPLCLSHSYDPRQFRIFFICPRGCFNPAALVSRQIVAPGRGL